MEYRTRLIFPNGEVIDGILTLEGQDVHFEEKDVEIEFIASPSFFNAHVHLGDSHLRDPPYMELEELVGPGGFKFRNLRTDESAINSIKNSIDVAFASGTTILADFREGGIEGINILRKADLNRLCFPFARPFSVEEAKLLTKDEYVKGFGMSSTRDHKIEFLEEIRKIANRSGKLFGIHAGERDDKDVDEAINLEPDFLVHMNKARKDQIKLAMDEEIPIVSCFRSNAFFGLLNLNNYRLLSDYDRWLIGTDNVMISSPSMLIEIKFACYLLRKDIEVFKAAIRGFEIFNFNPALVIFHRRTNLMDSLNPVASIVRRAEKEDIEVLKLVNFFKIKI